MVNHGSSPNVLLKIPQLPIIPHLSLSAPLRAAPELGRIGYPGILGIPGRPPPSARNQEISLESSAPAAASVMAASPGNSEPHPHVASDITPSRSQAAPDDIFTLYARRPVHIYRESSIRSVPRQGLRAIRATVSVVPNIPRLIINRAVQLPHFPFSKLYLRDGADVELGVILLHVSCSVLGAKFFH